MPSIKSQVEKNAERIAQGGDLVQAAGPSNNAANPTPMPPPPPVTGLPVRGYYPQGMTLDQDFGGTSQITRTGPNMRSPTFPKQPGIVSTIISKATAAVSSAAASLIIKVNNMLAPNQSVINFLNGTGMIITVDAAGNLVFNSTSSGDGLTHSTMPWESDPAYIILRDDFTNVFAASATTAPVTSIGSLGWNLYGTTPQHAAFFGGAPPYIGQFWWDQDATADHYAMLNLPQNGLNGGSNGGSYGWALFDNPGWQLTWVFRFGSQAPGNAASPNLRAKSMYLGLCGLQQGENISNNPSARPEVFFGVRYDTSGYVGTKTGYACTAVTMSGSNMAITGTFTGANSTTGTSWIGQTFVTTGFANGPNNGAFICTAATTTTLTLTNPNGVNATVQTATATTNNPFVLTAAANGNGIQVVYTGTITNGGTNNFVGQMFYVSGFGNAGNNGGPWKCTANSTTTITLANPVVTGSTETHAGYAASPRIADSTLVLEAVINPSYGVVGRNNVQGTTLDTGVAPAIGTWHRLDIICNSAGSITLVLDSTSTLTASVGKQTITTGAAGLTGVVATDSSQLLLTWSSAIATAVASSPWCTGSQVTISGFSGAQAGFNTTWGILANQATGGSNTLVIDYPSATVASGAVAGTMTGYPGVFPVAIYGNDNNGGVTSTATFWVDFFSFVWNPNLGPNAPGTPTSTLPRYW